MYTNTHSLLILSIKYHHPYNELLILVNLPPDYWGWQCNYLLRTVELTHNSKY